MCACVGGAAAWPALYVSALRGREKEVYKLDFMLTEKNQKMKPCTCTVLYPIDPTTLSPIMPIPYLNANTN